MNNEVALLMNNLNESDKAIETYDRIIACLKDEWGYKNKDAPLIEAKRKKGIPNKQ